MIYADFQGKKLPKLGFGAMRLPTTADGQVDEAQVEQMVACAMKNGVNYFDTAYPYHGGMSEVVLGRVLSKYPRESYYLADKYPGHQISDRYDPAEIFEEQLRRCGVEYFDFYLLHNVYEKSIEVYLDPQWGIIDYFREQKRLGRIRHLGFSTHGRPDTIRRFLDECGEDMEFCQIQLNYLDWTLQSAKRKYQMLTRRGIPVWVMEPVRGGKLAKLPEQQEQMLKERRQEESVASWGFRFLQNLPNVAVVLSGMSNMEQMEDNIKTFSGGAPLTGEETDLLLELAEGMKNTVPCTGCRYCVDWCPVGLDIPLLMKVCGELRFAPTTIGRLSVDALPENKRPGDCLSCGRCVKMCPQNIKVPAVMRELDQILSGITSWDELCRQRAQEQKRLNH
ncbi:MAG: aldo/keto reductase [Oscillospiraceae bacterium]|nr:aldo/keto reductase [Oscillospiraceae bacterium]